MKLGILVTLCLAGFTLAEAAKLPTVAPTFLQDQLADQVQRMIDAGHLAPGIQHVADHYNFDCHPDGTIDSYYQFDDYWHNPADTVYTLSIAIQHLPKSMQTRAKSYLQDEFNLFPPYIYIHMGPGGARREIGGLPPSFTLAALGFTWDAKLYHQNYLVTEGPRQDSENMKGWKFNPFNFYACWKYAQVFPSEAKTILNKIRNKVEAVPTDETYLRQRIHILNEHIAGYYGYLFLQDMVKEKRSATVVNYLDHALQKRLYYFNSIDPVNLDGWEQGGFLYMVPELADYLRTNASVRLQTVFDYLNWAEPYWHIPVANESLRYVDTESVNGGTVEGATQDVYCHWALFQAAAHALKWSREKLEQYLHGAAVFRGDLFYIQNLVATLGAAGSVPPATMAHQQ
jgi:hypothetical protein